LPSYLPGRCCGFCVQATSGGSRPDSIWRSVSAGFASWILALAWEKMLGWKCLGQGGICKMSASIAPWYWRTSGAAGAAGSCGCRRHWVSSSGDFGCKIHASDRCAGLACTLHFEWQQTSPG
jgi:hypothetical protein